MTQDHFTYRVTWSPEDGEHVGLCAEFPSLRGSTQHRKARWSAFAGSSPTSCAR